MNDDETLRTPSPRPDRRPEELLGRRVRYQGVVGRVNEVNVLSTPHVVILTRDGVLLRVPEPDWGDIEVLR